MGRGSGNGRAATASMTAGWDAVIRNRPRVSASSALGGAAVGLDLSHLPANYQVRLAELLAFDGPAIVLSDAPFWLNDSEQARATKGPVMVFDPYGLTGHRSMAWSPLSGVVDWASASRAANRFAACGKPHTDGDVYDALTRDLLPAMMLYSSHGGDGDPVARLLALATKTLPHRELGDFKGKGAASMTAAVDRFSREPEKVRTQAIAAAFRLLRAYRYQRVLATTTDGSSNMEQDMFGRGAGTIYMVSDPKSRHLLMPMFSSITAAVTDRARTDRRKMLLCTDETFINDKGFKTVYPNSTVILTRNLG